MKTSMLCLAAVAILGIASCNKSGNDDNRNQVVDTDPVSCCGTSHVFSIVGNDSIYIPNIFTHNGDGTSDFFWVYISDSVSYLDITIANDTGMVYYFKDSVFGGYASYWDGTDVMVGNGDELAEGTYDYRVFISTIAGDTATFWGTVCMVRLGALCPQTPSQCRLPYEFRGFDAAIPIDTSDRHIADLIFCN